jgi:2-C-methyl-D-erythritol 4-phosphate cytidylyltransferase
MPTAAILLAAGSGVRMGAGIPKALIPLRGRPMLAWSLDAIEAAGLDQTIVVAPPGHVRETERALGATSMVDRVLEGGATRAHSVAHGLGTLADGIDVVAVHDAARPLLSPDLVGRTVAALAGVDGAIAAVPLADTLKRADEGLLVAATVDRSVHWLAQTPQCFWRHALEAAVERGISEDRLHAATDCASLVEAIGGRVRLVPSQPTNMKLTTLIDLEIADRLLAERLAEGHEGEAGHTLAGE